MTSSNPWEETQHSSLDSDRVCRSDSVRYGSWETTAIIMRFWSVWTDCSDGENQEDVIFPLDDDKMYA